MNVLIGTFWNAFSANVEMLRPKGRPGEKTAPNISNSNCVAFGESPGYFLTMLCT